MNYFPGYGEVNVRVYINNATAKRTCLWATFQVNFEPLLLLTVNITNGGIYRDTDFSFQKRQIP